MVMYAYKGIGPSGKAVSGVKDADSPKLVRALLRKDGVVVTSVELPSRAGQRWRSSPWSPGSLWRQTSAPS